MTTRLFFLSLCFFITGCNQQKSDSSIGHRGFYYWQTNLWGFNWNDSTYRDLKVSKVYYRYFDVDWNAETHEPMPVSPLHWDYFSSWQPDAEMVPVVFITNETFKNLSVDDSRKLATHVYHKVYAMMASLLASDVGYEIELGYWQQDPYQMKSKDFQEHARYDSLFEARMNTIHEIQFDCDWTESTKEKYFAFLQECTTQFKDKLVSSTIRLYQYKYPEKAGVPPVKRGMLMCYNAGDARNVEEFNSIFDQKTVMSYIKGVDYPLPLDYALPIFQWALLYQGGKLTAILPVNSIKDIPREDTGDGIHYHVTDDYVYGFTSASMLLRKGDEIRLETPDMESIIETAEYLGEHKNNADAVITLYHLNDHDFQKYSKEIKTIFNSF